MDNDFPLQGNKGKDISKIVREIKSRKFKGKHDCICGISGGRDSMYTLYYLKKVHKLNPLAVHFNDGFGNPVAGRNMVEGCDILGIKLITITSDWRESKDIRLAFLKASTPDLGTATDIGIATALFGVATKENIKYVIIGQSFRTEGIAPLLWNYLDGKYVKDVLQCHGTKKFRPWQPTDPGFNLGMKEIFFYTVLKRIKTIPLLYYLNYDRQEVDKILEKKLKWKNTGAHYFDDLYQSLMTHVLRLKFNIDRRLFNYSALVRSKQMTREFALEKVKSKYNIEDPEIISLCLKRMGLTEEEFKTLMRRAPLTFLNYKNNFKIIKLFKPVIYILSKWNYLPNSTYFKYFKCGL
ncbi:MAG: N-acetyl sugar amidotransferase [Flavobacteriaceae bacterium]|nr:N-acetyl sugar amidotransferase [Flavobacteriaceae bacterium]